MLKSFLTALLTLTVAFPMIFGAKAQEKVTVDKIVAVVGNSIILYSDVEMMARQLAEYRRQEGYTSDREPMVEALEEMMLQKLLYNQALIDSIEISSERALQEADERVFLMTQEAGSVQELEAEFNMNLYGIKKEIAYRMEEQQYAQMMRNEIYSKVTITPGEVDRFYRKMDKDSLPMVPIQYIYSQIVKYPVSTTEAKQRAREQLLKLRERIINGDRFETLARMYSEDPGSANRGGDLGESVVEAYEGPFARALEKLRPGQVSEVVETKYGFHLIQLMSKSGNLYSARHILVRPEFTEEELLNTNHFLDSIARQINADSITFEQAALQHSEDKYSKYNGGLASNLAILEIYSPYNPSSYATTKHYKDNLNVDDFRALDRLEVGQISRAFLTEDEIGNQISKIVRLDEIIPSHIASIKEDYLLLEQMALEQKTEAEFKRWLDKKIAGMYIRVDPDFRVPEEFENKNWLK